MRRDVRVYQSAHALDAFSGSSPQLLSQSSPRTLSSHSSICNSRRIIRTPPSTSQACPTSLPQPGPLAHFAKKSNVTIVEVTPDVEPFPLSLQLLANLRHWLGSPLLNCIGAIESALCSSSVSKLTFLALAPHPHCIGACSRAHFTKLGRHHLVQAYDIRQQPDKIGRDVRKKKQEIDQMGGKWGGKKKKW